jgi:protein-S-isoprenylcysteine O-methyltransferase Ste14
VTPERLAVWVWLIWWASWWVAALVRNRTVARPAVGRVSYRLIPALGAILLFAPFARLKPEWLTWHLATGAAWATVVVIVVGFLFTWWARIHLGRLWSSDVTRKEGHRVVDSGPYRLVRHPIYTGISVAAFATAVLRGTPISLLGAATLTYGFYLKARIEERFLTEELGDRYSEYAKRTPMLVPFVKSSGD